MVFLKLNESEWVNTYEISFIRFNDALAMPARLYLKSGKEIEVGAEGAKALRGYLERCHPQKPKQSSEFPKSLKGTKGI